MTFVSLVLAVWQVPFPSHRHTHTARLWDMSRMFVRIWQYLTYAMLDFGIINRLYVTVALNSNVFLAENRRKHEVSTDSLA